MCGVKINLIMDGKTLAHTYKALCIIYTYDIVFAMERVMFGSCVIFYSHHIIPILENECDIKKNAMSCRNTINGTLE